MLAHEAVHRAEDVWPEEMYKLAEDLMRFADPRIFRRIAAQAGRSIRQEPGEFLPYIFESKYTLSPFSEPNILRQFELFLTNPEEYKILWPRFKGLVGR